MGDSGVALIEVDPAVIDCLIGQVRRGDGQQRLFPI